MNSQTGSDPLSPQQLWEYQCQVHGCKMTFLTIEELAGHLISQLSKTHIAYLNRINGLRELHPSALANLSVSAKVPAVMWQGRYIQGLNSQTVLVHSSGNNLSPAAPSNAVSAVTETIPARVKKISPKKHSESKNTATDDRKMPKEKKYSFDSVSGMYKCLFPECPFESKITSIFWRHSKTHETGPVVSYRCLAEGCSEISLRSDNILRHIERRLKAESKIAAEGAPHQVLFKNNQQAIENSKSPERLKFLDAMKCIAIKNKKPLSPCEEKSDQQPRGVYPETSDGPCEATLIPLVKNSVLQEAERVPQSDCSDLACLSPIEPYPYGQLQESPASVPVQESRANCEDRAVDLQTDSFPSFIDEELSLYPPEDTQSSFVLPDSDAFDHDLFYLDPADMRVHTSIDPDLILLTPHLKRRRALNSSSEVKRRRTLF